MNCKLVAITGALMLSLGACTPAQMASYNLSNDSDNQLDVLLSSGMSDDLMSKTVEEDWLVLV